MPQGLRSSEPVRNAVERVRSKTPDGAQRQMRGDGQKGFREGTHATNRLSESTSLSVRGGVIARRQKTRQDGFRELDTPRVLLLDGALQDVASNRVERVLHVRDQIVRVLDADGDSDRLLRDAALPTGFLRH